MHRIDTPTAQADKFGPGKNGFTNGDPATGRRATDLNSDMWDAVQEEVCTVIEESGLTLNKDQHNQLYQAIVKIITSKIPDALLKKNNLSDLADKALARANLQLKTAALADIQTSKDDVTAGRVLVNGGALALRTTLAKAGTAISDFNDLPGNSVSFGYGDATNSPGFTGSVIDYSGTNGGYRVQIATQYNGSGNRIAFRTRNGDASGVWNAWGEIYHTMNKPTATDVGALPIVGGTLSGALAVVQNGPAITVQCRAAGQAIYMIGKDYDGANCWYVGRGGSGYNVALYNYKGGNGLNINEDGSIALNLANGKTFTVNGQVVPSTYANFDERYQAKGNYTPAGQAYTKAESDGKYQLKGNYALVGASYTKAESDARYGVVNGIRRGGQQLRNPTDEFFGNWESPAGCVVTGITMENRSDGRKLGVYFRQMQYLNKQTNTWVNIGD